MNQLENVDYHHSCRQSLAHISLHLLSLLGLVRFKDGSNAHVDDVRDGVHYLVRLGGLQAASACQTIFSCKEPGWSGKDKGRVSRIPKT